MICKLFRYYSDEYDNLTRKTVPCVEVKGMDSKQFIRIESMNCVGS